MQDVLKPRSRVFFRAYSVYQIAANLSPRYIYPQALLPFFLHRGSWCSFSAIVISFTVILSSCFLPGIFPSVHSFGFG